MELTGVRILGVVLNKVKMEKGHYGSYYGKYYGKYYGRYYGNYGGYGSYGKDS
jgi:Mrp family chromosome partitioning ATPase